MTTNGQSNLSKRPHRSRTWTVPKYIQINTCLFEPIQDHNANGILTSSAVFAQLTAECLYITLYNGLPHSSLKIAPSHEGCEPHLIHGSLGPPESSI